VFRDAPIVMEGYVTDFCVAALGSCHQLGDPRAPFSDRNQYSTPMQAQRIIASVQCDGTAACEPRESAAAGFFQIFRARLGIADAHPPTFRVSPSGSLLDAVNLIAGERSVRFDGSDLGGGVYSAEVVVDGATVAESSYRAGGAMP
jgi:hypothetical protein